jgi:lysophospholipase L1-like esterase
MEIGTVTTIPAGSDATASITGTPENPVLNLGIPKGDKGDAGEVTQAEFDELKSAINNAIGYQDSYSETDKSLKGSATAYYAGYSTNVLTAGTELTFSLTGYTGAYFNRFKVFLFDANNSFTQIVINGVGSWQQNTPITYTIDNLKVYTKIRFYVETTATETENPIWTSNWSVSVKGTVQENIDALDERVTALESGGSVLDGVTIGFLGDSFTAPTTFYGSLIAAKTGCTAVNYGISGRRYYNHQHWTSGGVEYDVPAAWESVKDMQAGLDVVCSFCGINDANNTSIYTTKLGTINDAALTQTEIDNGATASTSYQGCKTTMELLMAKYPTAKILMILPPHVLDASYNPSMIAYPGIETIIEAEKTVAKFYGIQTVDLYSICTELNNFSGNVSRYRQASNNIHPNNAGQKAMAHYIKNALVELVQNNYLAE